MADDYTSRIISLAGSHLGALVRSGKLRVVAERPGAQAQPILREYANRPVDFARDKLGIELVPLQRRAIESLLEPPYCTICPSAHEQGKSLLGAVTVLWWFSTRSPAIVLTTAPTARQVKDILWKEIRRLHRKSGLRLPFFPRDCRIERSADDFAYGFTSGDGTGAQGQHGENILLVIDEAIGVSPEIKQAFESQFSPPGHAWINFLNPTDTSSWVYQEMTASARTSRTGGKSWHVVRMNAMDHPNIAAELAGLDPPVPYAMRLEKFDRQFRKWSQLIGPIDTDPRLVKATDIIWPPVDAKDYIAKTKQKPRIWRSGPLADARLLGRFPAQGVNSVWSDGDWMAATRDGYDLLPQQVIIPEIGCDVARFGDDWTESHVRSATKSLHHEAANGQDTVATTARLIQLADHYAFWYNSILGTLPMSQRAHLRSITGKDILIKVDDSGVGGGVTDQLLSAGYSAIPINSAAKAMDSESYPNIRSELWFSTVERARDGDMDLSGIASDIAGAPLVDSHGDPVPRLIDEDVIDELKQQFMAATWTLDNRGRRVICEKDEQKKKLGRSPDGADAVNLAYYEAVEEHGDAAPEIISQRSSPYGRR